VQSVLNQSYEDWELIIINDASTDDTASQIRQFEDKRIILLHNKVNQGISKSRNIGVGQAKGEWLAFLDSDDLWDGFKLEKQLLFMEKLGTDISYTATAYINERGDKSSYVLNASPLLSYKSLLRGNKMSLSSVMLRKRIMLPFPEGYMHEDYAVWLRIAQKTGDIHGLNEPLLIYRLSKGSKSGARLASAKMLHNTYLHMGFGRFTASLFTMRYAIHSVNKRFKVRFYLRG